MTDFCIQLLFLSLLASLLTLSLSDDRVIYDLSSQQSCVEVTQAPTYDCRWAAGLNVNADEVILHGDVVAYKILWSNGDWTNWFVTGLNDIDIKFNPYGRSCAIAYKANSMRRMWSYFYDHTHTYILCSDPHSEEIDESNGPSLYKTAEY